MENDVMKDEDEDPRWRAIRVGDHGPPAVRPCRLLIVTTPVPPHPLYRVEIFDDVTYERLGEIDVRHFEREAKRFLDLMRQSKRSHE
jgi:hypothetical protein